MMSRLPRGRALGFSWALRTDSRSFPIVPFFQPSAPDDTALRQHAAGLGIRVTRPLIMSSGYRIEIDQAGAGRGSQQGQDRRRQQERRRRSAREGVRVTSLLVAPAAGTGAEPH
jgi:hypothetical protein